MIKALKQPPHEATLTFSPLKPLSTDPTQCYRLRIETFSIQLSGVTFASPNAPKKNIHIRLSCNGRYHDILREPAGTRVTFVGKPISVLCKHSAEGDPNSTHIAHLNGRAYLPSPYTTWAIRIVNPNDFNLEGLSMADISCTGKAILEERAALMVDGEAL
jgi:hypothetical protein